MPRVFEKVFIKYFCPVCNRERWFWHTGDSGNGENYRCSKCKIIQTINVR